MLGGDDLRGLVRSIKDLEVDTGLLYPQVSLKSKRLPNNLLITPMPTIIRRVLSRCNPRHPGRERITAWNAQVR